MSREVPNQCVDRDVSRPLRQAPAAAPCRADDLTEGQLWVLLELALRNGGHPADRCYTMYGFEPTADDRQAVEWGIGLYREQWQPWIALYPNARYTLPRIAA